MNTSSFKILATFILAIQVAGCQAPAESSSLTSSSSNQKPKASPTPAPGAANTSLTNCGAPIGGSEVLKNLKVCVEKKMFFDRQKRTLNDKGEPTNNPDGSPAYGQCQTTPAAPIACQVDAVKALMTSTEATNFGKYFDDANSLKDFQLDQVLDCTNAQTKALYPDCAAASGSMYQLYFVKLEGSLVRIKTLPLYLPTAK